MTKPIIQPIPAFDHQFEQDELALLLNNPALAKRCGISDQQRRNWLYGRRPIPKVAYIALRSLNSTVLPEQFGPWQGFYLEREHLCCPFVDVKMHIFEFIQIDEYRRRTPLNLNYKEL